jgi:filamentous hemagglutinin family protein
MKSLVLSGCSVLISGTVLIPLTLSTPGVAQVVPDNTLGNENSVVTPLDANTDRIDGGALRNSLLFHSFDQFNIPEEHGVYFANPDAVNTIFSRVTGVDPSLLFGTLGVLGDADLIFINPNGILFGPNAELDLNGAFTATTATGVVFPGGEAFSALEPEAAPLLTVNMEAPVGVVFEGEHPGAIVNVGNLAVTPGQALTLIGGEITNTGNLQAPEGSIEIVAAPGNTTVHFEESGHIQSWSTIGDNVIDFTGQSVAALVDIAKLDLDALPVDVSLFETGTVVVSGELDASSDSGIGGNVGVLGDRVALIDTMVNVSGLQGGGEVLIGGEYQEQGSSLTASETIVDARSVVLANALQSGNGGRVIVWADETAYIHGTLATRGGTISGNGGFIETSGQQDLYLTSVPDASAPNGDGGTWLIDPTDITIANGGGAIETNIVDVANINSVLNTGTSVTISTSIGSADAGNITQNNDAPISKTAGGNATLILQAENNVFVNTDITSNNNQLHLELMADSDSSGIGGIIISDANINTNNGDFIGTGNNISITNNSSVRTQAGEINLAGTGKTNVPIAHGIIVEFNSLVESSVGNIALSGTGGNQADLAYGVAIENDSIIRSQDGDITLIGIGGNNSANTDGVGVALNGVVETTGIGSINLTGVGGTGGDAQGVVVGVLGGRVISNNGNILITGTSNGNGMPSFSGDHGIFLFTDGIVESTGNGNITLDGRGGNSNSVSNAGVWVDGELRISGNGGNIDIIGVHGNGSQPTRGIELLSNSQVTTTNGTLSLDANGGVVMSGTEISSDSGDIQIIGNGRDVGDEVYGIAILENSIISSNHGNINFAGKGGNGSGNGHRGIGIIDSQISSSDDGDIILHGIGGNTPGVNNDGILVIESLIKAQGFTSILLNGRAGEGSNALEGIIIAYGSRIISQDGNIELSGTGGLGNSTEIVNSGISFISNTALGEGSEPILIESEGYGDILISGTGGTSSLGTRPINFSRGIFLEETFSPTKILSNQGNIHLTGYSEDGTFDTVGLFIHNRNIVESANGNIFLEGFTGSNSNDVLISGSPSDLDATAYALNAGGSIGLDGTMNLAGNSLSLTAGEDIIINAGGINGSGFVSSALTFNSGGQLQVNEGAIRSRIFGPGVGRNININADVVSLRNGGRVVTGAIRDGIAGDINITARQLIIQGIELGEGDPDDFTTGIGTDTFPGSSGSGGEITVQVSELIQIVGSQPGEFSPALTNRTAVLDAGLLRTGLTSSSLGSGDAGNISINSDRLEIRNGAGIASAALGIEPDAGSSGDINLTIRELEFRGLAGLATVTIGAGAAGSITIGGPGSTEDNLAPAEQVFLYDGAAITADAIPEAAQEIPELFGLNFLPNVNETQSVAAGNIDIAADSVLLDNRSRITTSSTSGDGGTITFRDIGILRLRRGQGIGGIFTDGGAGQDVGRGGGINITADAIFAVDQENTDISARAFIGRGGGIEIEVQSPPVGIEFRPDLTPLSDITAGSDQGPSGTVNIETLGFDPTQGLASLPDEPQGPEVIEGCAVRGNTEAVGFFDLGRGGKLPAPEDLMSTDAIIAEWTPLDWDNADIELGEDNTQAFHHSEAEPHLIATCGVKD